tara:strand:+ start:2376 stop:2870 length:495 start_codon:yes stop_codon:yes gene_type:complete
MIYAIHILTIPLAIIYSHLTEWFIHKYILHGLGKRKDNFWSFHWHAHHKKCRKNNFYDVDYLDDWQGPPLREKLGLFLLILLHSPLVIYAPLFFITLIFCAVRYYKVHKYAHLNPIWGKIFLTWHHDHHMGKDQDANWGVTVEWVDKLLGTRKKNAKIKKEESI